MGRKNNSDIFRAVFVKNQAAGDGDLVRSDKWLDKLYGKDRPRCRICRGRLDRTLPFSRCPWCGTPAAHEVGA